jgi:hypothetical protein
LGAQLCETGQLVLFGGLVTRNGGVHGVWGRDYAKRGGLRHLGAWLHEMEVLVVSEGSVTRNEAACIVGGLGYAKWGVGVVWGA